MGFVQLKRVNNEINRNNRWKFRVRFFIHQVFFEGFFRAVKRPQKLNLELSFETQSSHQSFSAVKMKLFELNL
jgi:hypothetical protein